MRQVGGEYLQEEGRLRGARPRVKAVIYPFDLDYGLAPGSGAFEHTAYGGEPGKLALEEGYFTTGSWTSPVMQTFSPNLDQGRASWENQAGYMETQVYLRSAPAAAQVNEAPYLPLTSGAEFPLAPYFQVKVVFQQTIRTWAVGSPEEADNFTAYAVNQAPDGGYESYNADGAFPGYVTRLDFEGRLTLAEKEILDPGQVRVELAQDFSELRSGDHVLVTDNRQGQWLSGSGNFYFQGSAWEGKKLALYHGWELPNGTVEWLLIYQGLLEKVAGMAHGWQDRHQVQLESQDWIAARLDRLIGVPSPEGQRQPFMRGPYRARGELLETIPAQVSDPEKEGSGSATLRLLGTYRGEVTQTYLLEAQTTGEVGGASFRWSTNQGQSWKGSAISTAGADNPVELEEGLAVYWEAGVGNDLVAGDRWTFTAEPVVYQYQIFGAPFESITAVYLNQEETQEGVEADQDTGIILVMGRSAQVEARVVKDATTHPVDIMADLLGEVDLSQALHQDSFDLAKSVTANYAIGVCFENLTARQALREILQRCLYDLWIDFGEIKLRAYLGDD
ncbi:MAG: hypothetical protein AB1491_12510 [Thermodesulfobacteriota bacterium]